METIRTLKKSLASLKKFKFSYLSHHDTLQETLAEHPPEFVFNLCDEGFKNKASMELHVPALLDMAGVPYTGAEPACLAMCYNKFVVRAVAAALDIPVPLETYYDSADQMASLPSIFPALLKPVFGDSSVGITQRAVVFSAEQLINYLDELKVIVPNTPILIQEFLNGREYSVGLVGNSGNFQVLPVLEVDYGKLPKNLPQILSYESKWDPDSPYWNDIRYKEADLPEEERRKIVDHSIHLFDRLGCRDYARFDFRADAQGTIKLLEVNPNPGWCWDGKLNIMAGFQGLKYDDLLEMILNAAKERIFSKTR
jgi:D-alanine-D-alanine ligase